MLKILLGHLRDENKIVKTFAMQALADLATADARLRPQIVHLCGELTTTGRPGMKSHDKKLLKQLQKQSAYRIGLSDCASVIQVVLTGILDGGAFLKPNWGSSDHIMPRLRIAGGLSNHTRSCFVYNQ